MTDHAVRLALGTDGAGSDERDSFAWSARTARRALGLAALRSLVAGESRAPLDAVRTRVAEIARLVHDGSPSVSGFDRWLAGLPPAGRAAVGAEAVTWATRLWCALDWRTFGAGAGHRPRPLVGQPPLRPAGPAQPGRGAGRAAAAWSC